MGRAVMTLHLEPITPVVRRDGDTLTIVEPAELAGRTIVSVEALPCFERFGNHEVCGLIRGHRGDCWRCSEDLVHLEGPWAVVKP